MAVSEPEIRNSYSRQVLKVLDFLKLNVLGGWGMQERRYFTQESAHRRRLRHTESRQESAFSFNDCKYHVRC